MRSPLFGNAPITARYSITLSARTPRSRGISSPRASLEEDPWELYDAIKDFCMANDLGRQRPDKLKALQALYRKVASVNRVLPIDDRSFERLNAALIGRPDLMAGRTSPTLRSGMNGMGENLFINIKNKSKTISAEA